LALPVAVLGACANLGGLSSGAGVGADSGNTADGASANPADGGSGNPADSASAKPGDATLDSGGGRAEASADDAGVDAGGGGTNVVVNPGFEDGTGGCGIGWSVNMGTLVRSSTAHSGQYSCQVCGSTAGYYLYPDSPEVADAATGDSYYLAAWISLPPGADPDAGAFTQLMFADNSNNDLTDNGGLNDPTTWQLMDLTYAVTSDVAGMPLFLLIEGGAAAGNTCFLIDDVVMSKQ
jgi:hypothetical protein